MQLLTGTTSDEPCSVVDFVSYMAGNVRTVVWILKNGTYSAIITLRHSLLKNSCVILINDKYYSSYSVFMSGCVIHIDYEGLTFTITVSPQPTNDTVFNYVCKSKDYLVYPFFTQPFSAPLKQYLTVSVYFDPQKIQYEFHVAEFKWCVHILVKSLDDIRMLDRTIQSLYRYSSYSKMMPKLPQLKLVVTPDITDVEGYVVADELQEYFDCLLALDYSAYCPDLLKFLELPVSIHAFQYSRAPTTVKSDMCLFV